MGYHMTTWIVTKDCLISESFSLWHQSPKQGAESPPSTEHYPTKEKENKYRPGIIENGNLFIEDFNT